LACLLTRQIQYPYVIVDADVLWAWSRLESRCQKVEWGCGS
jgi:hypothetical protein